MRGFLDPAFIEGREAFIAGAPEHRNPYLPLGLWSGKRQRWEAGWRFERNLKDALKEEEQ
jgi:ribosome modulation factor